MRTILMLVQKDLIQQGNRLLYSGVILIVFSLTAAITDGAAIGLSVTATMVAALAMTNAMSITYEDDQGGLVFLRMLPIAPQWLVLGRYLAALVMAVGLYACAAIPLLFIRPLSLDLSELGVTLFASFCAILPVVGLAFLLFYHYGYRAVRYGFTGAFFGIMILSAILRVDVGAKLNSSPVWFTNMLASPIRLLTLVGLIALGVYALLWLLAAHGLRQRDL